MPRLMPVRFHGTVLACLLAAGCGGGGGGGASGPSQPVINAQAPPTGTAGVAYSTFTFTVMSGGTAPFTWTETGALPPGLSLSSVGLLSGTPTSGGSFPFTVTVTDSTPMPQKSSAPFTITVNPPANTPSPIINSAVIDNAADGLALPTVIVGTPYPTVTFQVYGGLAPLVWSEAGALPAGIEFTVGGVLSGTPQSAGKFPITISLKDALNRSAPGVLVTVRVASVRPAAGFTQTAGPMTMARSGHTATLLLDGRVLIAGGSGATAELYDPTSETFTATGNMTVARSGHTATLLADKTLPNYGYVLVVGRDSSDQTAELYDPTTGTFTATGSMVVAHDEPTATLLQNGQVLIAGGGTASAELYNPATGTFTATGNMVLSRSGHTATLLPNGEVLIAGGATPGFAGTATAELYNPASGTFTATASMNGWRGPGHTATLLADGTVLLVGAANYNAEVFDPATGTFSLVGNSLTFVNGSTATVRGDGTVVLAGGSSIVGWRATDGKIESAPVSTSFAELFAPECEGFIVTPSLMTARDSHTATVLADSITVLVAGGVEHTIDHSAPEHGVATPLASAELYR
jgi:Galactose oxidase, central domain